MTQTLQTPPLAALSIPVLETSKFPCLVRQWELVNFEAEGGLAQIFRARPAGSQPNQPALYALKMLLPDWQNDAQAVRLLNREALVGQSVSHPHLIPILFASVQQSPRFVVMPWLEGATLEQRLAAGQHFDLPQVLWIARQTAEALDALHQAGWMHGDVKPSNIMLSAGGHATLLDLGFARRRDETGSVVDRCVLGTFHYIAPEFLTSALRADIRSDIYSLGAVLYRILAGRLPFVGYDLGELASQHKQSLPPDLRRIAPHLPAGVARLVHQMLSKDPLRRPQTPRELIEILARLEIESFSERA
ncbi:MAG: serine/threonine-protein kinase [Thermoguttaceae bacterium]|jgi:serine/threonine-protein kinase